MQTLQTWRQWWSSNVVSWAPVAATVSLQVRSSLCTGVMLQGSVLLELVVCTTLVASSTAAALVLMACCTFSRLSWRLLHWAVRPMHSAGAWRGWEACWMQLQMKPVGAEPEALAERNRRIKLRLRGVGGNNAMDLSKSNACVFVKGSKVEFPTYVMLIANSNAFNGHHCCMARLNYSRYRHSENMHTVSSHM